MRTLKLAECEDGMSDRRGFLKKMMVGVAALGWGTRNLFAQVRPRYVMESAPGSEITMNGKRYLYFGGVGYHALQGHPALLKAAGEALVKFGMHTATGRGGYGNTPDLLGVEKKVAEFFGTEDAAYLASGYLANAAGYQVLAATGRYDAAFIDEAAHFSAKDFVSLLQMPVFTFAHRDPEDLRGKLRANLKARQKPLLISDGLFSTYGYLAPVPDYVEILKPYQGSIWLDDAHAVGVIGASGRGTYEHYGLKSDELLFGATLSKAFGAYGGIIPGKEDFVQAVRAGHVNNGATSVPSPAVAAALAGLDMLMQHPELRTQLWKNARMMKDGLRQMGFSVDGSPVPIAAWKLKSAEEMDRVRDELMNRGICIQRSFYVGAGPEGVLRVAVFSSHTGEQINRLLSELKNLV